MWDAVMLAARIEHLVAVCGESVRESLVREPRALTSVQIVGLCCLEPEEVRRRLAVMIQEQTEGILRDRNEHVEIVP